MIGPLVPYLTQAWPPGRNPTAPERPADQADPAPTAPGGPDDPAPPAPNAAGAPVLAPEPPADQPAPGRVQPTGMAETPGGDTRQGAQDPTAQAVSAADPAARLASDPRELGLSPAEQTMVRKLAGRDRQVRNHEQAHVAAGGSSVTGGPSYSFQTGPDGRRYAVGGEVPIDASEVPGDPKATIAKARQIRRAALAPADPSPQDRAVAASASQMEVAARREVSEEKRAAAEEAALAGARPEGQLSAHADPAADPSTDSAADPLASRRPAPPPLSVRLNPLDRIV